MSNYNGSSLQFEENSENNSGNSCHPITVRTSPMRSREKQGIKSTVCGGSSASNPTVLTEITNFNVGEDDCSVQVDVVQQNKCDLGIERKFILQSACTAQQPENAEIMNKSLTTEQVGLAEELSKKDIEEKHPVATLNSRQEDKLHIVASFSTEGDIEFNIKELQFRFDKITSNLEAHTNQYVEDICEKDKLESNMETTTYLLKEVLAFQSELLEKLCSIAEDNEKLKSKVAAKEEKIKEINTEWEKASLDLTSFLLDGSKSLRDASDQIEYIAGSFAYVNVGIGEQIENAAKFCMEKEEKILLLERSLEDAQKTVTQMEQNLISLRGAAIVLAELQQAEKSSAKESAGMSTTFNEKMNMMSFENRFLCNEAQGSKTNEFAAASMELNMEADCMRIILGDHEDNRLMPEADLGCCKTMQFTADEKVNQDSCFFNQFEEACATMQEAEVLINALLKANENSKQLASKWKQSSETLMVEKASLFEEIEQLTCSLHLKDGENEKLYDQIRYSLVDMSNMISLLEGSFLHMQRDAEAMCKTMYSDALISAKEAQRIICFSRSSVEYIYAQALEKEFASFVLHQFSLAEYFKNYRNFDEDLIHHTNAFEDCSNNQLDRSMIGDKEEMSLNYAEGIEGRDQTAVSITIEAAEMGLTYDDKVDRNSELLKELEDVEVMLQGLLYEFSSLQKSTSRAECENIVPPLSQTWYELHMKTSQLYVLVSRIAKHEYSFDSKAALNASIHNIEQLKGKGDAIKTLEKKVVVAKVSLERQLISMVESIENDLRNVIVERDHLAKQVVSLQDRLDMANALAGENEAISIKAHQESEASRIRAELKEEEVKILKQLVEELEYTITVLEKKGHEMEEEVKRHQQMHEPLDIELRSQHQRLSNSTSEPAKDQLIRKLQSRSLELHEAHNQILTLEAEIAEQSKEIKWCKGYISELVLHAEAQASQYQQKIKWCKGYISELVLHAEAQASQYQQKYKTLEAMVHEVRTESSNLASTSPNVNKTEKRSMRTRRSSSPFRCMMGGMVHQKNLEDDQELSTAMLRIRELEALLVSRQKEVCLLNTRLAATESMTHDIIRDLLGVKLDMTNYANMMDHHQFQKIVKDTQQQTHKSTTMEKEILTMRRKINDLIEERDICILEVNRKDADICAIQMDVEQLQEREQLLIAENVLLKKEKINLHRRVAELDHMVTKVFGAQTNQPRVQQQIDCLLKSRYTDFRERPRKNEKPPQGVNNEQLSHYYTPESSHAHAQAKLDRR